MKLKPYEFWGYLPIVILLWFVTIYTPIYDEINWEDANVWVPIVWVLLMTGISLILSVKLVIMKLRVITIDKNGCVVEWLGMKRSYVWDDLLIVCHEIITTRNRKIARVEGVFFSTKAVKRNGKILTPDKIYTSNDIFHCFYYIFLNDEDRDRVLNYLKECGVKIEDGKELKKEEAYNIMVETRKKIRDERKKRIFP